MCDWRDINPSYGRHGRILLNARTISGACDIIRKTAQQRQTIVYSDLMNQLKDKGHRKISRRTIGLILGEVCNQVAQATDPSIYPSVIVVRKDTKKPGKGFWGLYVGANPPGKVPHDQRGKTLQQYQKDVFDGV